MPGVMVYCEHCNTFAEGRGIVIEGGSNVTVQGGIETCQRCRHMARMLDGTYSVVGDLMTFAAAEGWSSDRLIELGDAVRGAWKSGGVEAAAAAVEETEPSLAKRFGSKLKDPAWLAVLLAAIQLAAPLVKSDQPPPPINVTILNNIVIDVESGRP